MCSTGNHKNKGEMESSTTQTGSFQILNYCAVAKVFVPAVSKKHALMNSLGVLKWKRTTKKQLTKT